MGIDVTCSCGKRYAVTDDKAGKKLKCRHCQAIIDIPSAGRPPPVASMPPAASPAIGMPSPAKEAPAMPPPMVAETPWFYTHGGRPAGPVGESVLQALVRSGQVGLHEMAWRHGDANSRPVGTVPPFMASGDGTLPAMSPPPGKPKKRKTALWLSILLGWTGAHRFYLGQTGLGVALAAGTVLSVATMGLLTPVFTTWIAVDIALIASGGTKTDTRGIPLA